MAAKKPAAKKTAAKKAPAKKAPVKKAAVKSAAKPAAKPAAKKSAAAHAAPVKHVRSTSSIAAATIATPGTPTYSMSTLKPNAHSRPKRTRVGRGHGSGMVKTGGEGGKGQTVRSGGGKGPAFEGGQTPWARRLPQQRGISQKARDIGHFGQVFTVINVSDLADWDAKVEVSPQSLQSKGKIKNIGDGVKVLGGAKPGKTLPSGLTFRDMAFSASAREALSAAGAKLGDTEG
jgi:large subunit ribosomal protein L15